MSVRAYEGSNPDITPYSRWAGIPGEKRQYLDVMAAKTRLPE